jgi:predicted esterase
MIMHGKFRYIRNAFVFFVICSAWCPQRALTQSPTTITALRQALEQVKGAHGSIPPGSLESLAYQIDVAERIDKSFSSQAAQWRARAAKLIARAQEGVDPFPEQGGKILMRGYRSPISLIRQGYAIYTPPGYTDQKKYPLMIVMHGGSANGNLFLGVVLGNNMNWKDYPLHLWDDFRPQWNPEWIVVAPDGYGQIMWRWMGEQDVLDVIDDVQRHYRVDTDQIVLGGLSNGGVGAYNIGMRHAWRFAAVTAMAGAPSWLQYSGGQIPKDQRACMAAQSGMELAENAINTDFRYYHGRKDTGPMRPAFVTQFTSVIKKLGVPFRETWYDVGHDLLGLVHGRGAIYQRLAAVKKKSQPAEVRIVTGDYRANRQYWLTVTRLERFPELGRVRAVIQGNTLTIETRNVLALSVDLKGAPFVTVSQNASSNQFHVLIDGTSAYQGDRQKLGSVLQLAKPAGAWIMGTLPLAKPFEKQPGVSGPITDAYYGAMVHVYGSSNPAHVEALKKAAEKGSRGWPLWLWNYRQLVVSDREVTEAMVRDSHLILYGASGDNQLLESIKDKLPIRVDTDAVVIGTQRFSGKAVGVKYIYPNPLNPRRYVIVQAAVTPEAVMAGHNLPDFLPDYVVYDARTTRNRERLIFATGGRPLVSGFFDRFWKIAEPSKAVDRSPRPSVFIGGDESPPDSGLPKSTASRTADAAVDLKTKRNASSKTGQPVKKLSIPPPPPVPSPPERFLAPETDPAGRVARQVAQRVSTFFNYRAYITGATWVMDPKAIWSIRPEQECLESLSKQGISFRRHTAAVRMPIATPVQIKDPIDGVKFQHGHAGPLVVSCELASRLPILAKVLKKNGVFKVTVASAFRDKPQTSFHTMGLALDVSQVFKGDEVISVWGNYEKTPDFRTCEAPPAKKENAQLLRNIACDLAETHVFSSVLTPNYNEGHRDHYHIDIRPDDGRFFIR